jgi:hypothetical protein
MQEKNPVHYDILRSHLSAFCEQKNLYDNHSDNHYISENVLSLVADPVYDMQDSSDTDVVPAEGIRSDRV